MVPNLQGNKAKTASVNKMSAYKLQKRDGMVKKTADRHPPPSPNVRRPAPRGDGQRGGATSHSSGGGTSCAGSAGRGGACDAGPPIVGRPRMIESIAKESHAVQLN